jgi:Tol biopolymer transport system component
VTRGVIGGLLGAAVLMLGGASADAAVTNGRIAFDAMRAGGGGASDIATVKPDGRGWTDLTPGSHTNYCAPAWSPDGARIAFVEPRPQLPGGVDPGNGYLHVMNADGSNDNVLTLARTSHECIRPTWSADGAYIAYGGFQGSNFSQIYAIPSDGLGAPMDVDAGDIPVTNPSWSTDGTQIAFDGMDGNLYTTPVSRGPTGLSFGPRHRVGPDVGTNPDWSPDGTRLAIARSDELRGIWTVNSSDESDPRQITSGTIADDPSWSPDGAAIAFEDYSEIFTVPADGSAAPVQVTTSAAHGFDFAAQPDWQRRGH